MTLADPIRFAVTVPKNFPGAARVVDEIFEIAGRFGAKLDDVAFDVNPGGPGGLGGSHTVLGRVTGKPEGIEGTLRAIDELASDMRPWDEVIRLGDEARHGLSLGIPTDQAREAGRRISTVARQMGLDAGDFRVAKDWGDGSALMEATVATPAHFRQMTMPERARFLQETSPLHEIGPQLWREAKAAGVPRAQYVNV